MKRQRLNLRGESVDNLAPAKGQNTMAEEDFATYMSPLALK
jgi:hypothetical protein